MSTVNVYCTKARYSARQCAPSPKAITDSHLGGRWGFPTWRCHASTWWWSFKTTSRDPFSAASRGTISCVRPRPSAYAMPGEFPRAAAEGHQQVRSTRFARP